MDALRRSWELSKQVASAGVIVDAKDESASGYYRRYGFLDLPNVERRLFLPMGTIEQLFGFSGGNMDRAVQERLSRATISKFFQLARVWRLRCLSQRQLLGGMSNGVLHRLKCGQRKVLDPDTLTRVFRLLEISRALNMLYGRKLADSWVRLPNTNPMFQGEPPLEYMVKGGVPALMRVRQLLDSRRAGH